MTGNMAPDLEAAQQLAVQGDFDGAFGPLRGIAHDQARPPADRAVAFALMSMLVAAWPSLYPDDQTGLTFLRQAIELNPDEEYAWWNVIESFGDHYPAHQDVPLLRRAFDWLGHAPLDAADAERLERHRRRYAQYLG
jgi:hypothetical protein